MAYYEILQLAKCLQYKKWPQVKDQMQGDVSKTCPLELR